MDLVVINNSLCLLRVPKPNIQQPLVDNPPPSYEYGIRYVLESSHLWIVGVSFLGLLYLDRVRYCRNGQAKTALVAWGAWKTPGSSA